MRSPGLSRSGLAWRITPARRPRAAPRTSPTAAPEHGVRRDRRLIDWLVRSRQTCSSLATSGGHGFPWKSPSICSGEQALDAGDRGSPRRGKGGRGRWVGRRGPTKMAKELRGARSGARSQRFGTTVGDSRPAKLLVEPPLATPGHGLELHGMQDDPRLARACARRLCAWSRLSEHAE